MKTSVVLEAEHLPKHYRSTVVRLAFKTPDNPLRPVAHLYQWLDVIKHTDTHFTMADIETVERIIAIVRGEKVLPRKNRSRLALWLGL